MKKITVILLKYYYFYYYMLLFYAEIIFTYKGVLGRWVKLFNYSCLLVLNVFMMYKQFFFSYLIFFLYPLGNLNMLSLC